MAPAPHGNYLVTGGADFQVMSQAAAARVLSQTQYARQVAAMPEAAAASCQELILHTTRACDSGSHDTCAALKGSRHVHSLFLQRSEQCSGWCPALFCSVSQVKSWTPSGDLLSASGHHHTAIQCAAVVPLQQQAAGAPPSRRASTADRRASSAGSRVPSAGSSSGDGRDGSSTVPCKVWVGAADGSLSVCTDVSGSGTLDPASWRILRVEGLTGATHPATDLWRRVPARADQVANHVQDPDKSCI
jgi:hypothetical protein